MLDISDWKDHVDSSVQALESVVRKVYGASSLPHSWQPTSMTTSQWSLVYQSLLGKEAWQPSELTCHRKWVREEKSKEMSRRGQEHQSYSVSTELKKGDAEDVCTTTWGTRSCGKCWRHLLHERSVDVWSTEGKKSLTQQWKETMVLKISRNIKGELILLTCN